MVPMVSLTIALVSFFCRHCIRPILSSSDRLELWQMDTLSRDVRPTDVLLLIRSHSYLVGASLL